ncbi:hypothetical protein T01_16190 [Trichinella spiralis]|uniref:Uncharacterized protein n=1 Tax=Trichinella spiralis TaxID=6334 RepID=A0A0V1BSW2_TRISP|nr:hypothetical protein T01_16190 [Trichinella spiralis]
MFARCEDGISHNIANSYSSTLKIIEDVRLNCVEHKISHTSFTLLQLKEKAFHNLHHNSTMFLKFKYVKFNAIALFEIIHYSLKKYKTLPYKKYKNPERSSDG